MARARKRITRRDIRRPDQFISLTGRFFRFCRENTTRIILGSALFVALLLSFTGWRIYQGRQNRLAAKEYALAMAAYHDGRYEEALAGLGRVSGYRSHIYNLLGLLYQGHAYIALGRPSEAVPVLRRLLDREKEDPVLRHLAFQTLGKAYELAADCGKAVEAYHEAGKLQGPLAEDALLAKARCSRETGKDEEAVQVYKEFLSSFPQSERAREVELRIQALEAKGN